MGGLRLLYDRYTAGCMGSISSAHEAGYPGSNIFNPDRKIYAQASNQTPFYKITLSESRTMDTLVLVNTNFTRYATVRIAASNISADDSELLHTGHVPLWTPLLGEGEGDPGEYITGGYLDDAALAAAFPAGVVLTVDFPQTKARYWNISFVETYRAKPIIGVLYLCRRWEFVYQPNLGGMDSWTEDLTTIDYAEDGTAWVDLRKAREILDLECTVPENAAWWRGKNHFKKIGVGRPFVIDPLAARPPSLGARAWSRLYGHFVTLPKVESEGHLIWTVAMQVTETL